MVSLGGYTACAGSHSLPVLWLGLVPTPLTLEPGLARSSGLFFHL